MSYGLRYAAAIAAISLSVPLRRQPVRKAAFQIGSLNCNASGTVGFIFGSIARPGMHVFRTGGRVEHYTGTVSKFGVDIGFTRGGVLIWAVFAPGQVGPGALAGNYGGVTAGATVGVGLGANALVGGSNNSIALQPLSIEGTTGLNVAAGVASMTLQAAP